MPYENLTISADAGVARIAMHRQPTNPMDLAFVEELGRAFDEVAGRDDVVALVLTSALDGVFAAGADIRYLLSMTPEQARHTTATFQAVFSKLPAMQKVTIAAINGHALGGGCELALACDYRFMAEAKGRIGMPEVTLGILPGAGGTQRLARLLGRHSAFDLIINGTAMPAREALEVGLVDRVVAPDLLLEETESFARSFAAKASRAIGLIKRALAEGLDRPLTEGLAIELEAFCEVFQTPDAKEGLTAFLEKRKPEFTGR